MAKLEEYSKRIADYIYNDMDLSERREFEKDLETDEVLAREYRLQLKMVNYISAKSEVEDVADSAELEEAEHLVKEHRAEYPEDIIVTEEDRAKHQVMMHRSSKTGSLLRFIYPLLAAAAVILGVIIIRNIQTVDQGARLYAKYYRPLDEAGFVNRGEDGQQYIDLNEALEQYRKGDYILSSNLFTDLSLSHLELEEARLFLGLSRMGEESYLEAVDVFIDYQSAFDKYHYEASWYLALCYIKLNQLDKARDILQDLSSIEGDFGKNASKLMKRL